MRNAVILWSYKWLPRIFGCHCRDDRSFYYTRDGRRCKAPICARCTGELFGMLLGIVWSFFTLPDWRLLLAIMVPMVLDGTIQLFTRYESTNFRRFVTGFLFGFGLVGIFVLTMGASYRFGYNWAASRNGVSP